MVEGNPASAAAGIDGSPILSDSGRNIYVLDGTLSHISHKTFFAGSKESGINFDRVSAVHADYRCSHDTLTVLIVFSSCYGWTISD